MINFGRENKIYIWSGLTAIGILFFIFFSGFFAGEEARVRKFILKGKKATERKDIFACASLISTDYHDKYGNDHQSLLYTAKEVFAYYKNIIIGIEKMEIELDESRTQADVEIVASVLCQSKDNKTERIFEAGKGRFRVKLIKQDKKWQLLEAEFLEEVYIMGQKIA